MADGAARMAAAAAWIPAWAVLAVGVVRALRVVVLESTATGARAHASKK